VVFLVFVLGGFGGGFWGCFFGLILSCDFVGGVSCDFLFVIWLCVLLAGYWRVFASTLFQHSST
jgi:hypothetical protein